MDSMATSRILVTGGAGYLGGRLVNFLLKNQYDVAILDTFFFENEARIPGGVEIIQEDIRTVSEDKLQGFDAIVDLAAISNDPAGELDVSFTQAINFEGRARIAAIADKFKTRYILISSCSVYGYNESLCTEETKVNPLTTYSECAAELEAVVKNLTNDSVILRFGTLYGTSPFRFRSDIAINKMSLQALKAGMVELWGEGEDWRPFLHVHDAARAIFYALHKDIRGTYNVALDNFQMKEITWTIARLFEASVVRKDAGKDFRSYRVDYSKFRKDAMYQPIMMFPFGVKDITREMEEANSETTKWYRDRIGIKAKAHA
jgi:nucleoside-diphosphate-sugar epimerase